MFPGFGNVSMFFTCIFSPLLLRLLALLAALTSCAPCSFCYLSLATVKHLEKVSIMFAFFILQLLCVFMLLSSVLTDGELLAYLKLLLGGNVALEVERLFGYLFSPPPFPKF